MKRYLAAFLVCVIALSPLAYAAPSTPAWPSIVADSAIVIDFDTGEVLYEKDADTPRVPASMTKVMTAYIIFEELEAGNLSLDTMVPISNKNAQISRDSKNYPASVPLPYNASVSVDTLLKLILIPSASASCVVMAERISGSEAAFVQRMNETAARLGINAQYQNCHGAKVHYITARGQAALVRNFIQRFPKVLEYTSMTSVAFNGRNYANTNHLLAGSAFAYPGADGFKTGTISAAGYCLSATAVQNGHRLISVVMHSNNNTTRHTDSQKILDYGFRVLQDRSIFPDLTYHWARDAVESLAGKNVELHADLGGAFRPDEATTRAEFTAMLYGALEQRNALPAPPEQEIQPTFTDVTNHWAQSYIEKAAALGLVSGIQESMFAPDAPITRQEVMVIIDRALDLPDANGLGFADDGDIAFWALVPAARVTAAGFFMGSQQGQLQPKQALSRGEAATSVLRVLNYLG